jgi:hypothetical protein
MSRDVFDPAFAHHPNVAAIPQAFSVISACSHLSSSPAYPDPAHAALSQSCLYFENRDSGGFQRYLAAQGLNTPGRPMQDRLGVSNDLSANRRKPIFILGGAGGNRHGRF